MLLTRRGRNTPSITISLRAWALGAGTQCHSWFYERATSHKGGVIQKRDPKTGRTTSKSSARTWPAVGACTGSSCWGQQHGKGSFCESAFRISCFFDANELLQFLFLCTQVESSSVEALGSLVECSGVSGVCSNARTPSPAWPVRS